MPHIIRNGEALLKIRYTGQRVFVGKKQLPFYGAALTVGQLAWVVKPFPNPLCAGFSVMVKAYFVNPLFAALSASTALLTAYAFFVYSCFYR